MCTSLAAVALAKVGPRFSLTGSVVSFCGPKGQQDQLSSGDNTFGKVDRSIDSGLVGLGERNMKKPILRILAVLYTCCLAISAWTENLPASTIATPAPKSAHVTGFRIRTDQCGSALNWFTGQLEAVGIGYTVEKGEMGRFEAQSTALALMRLEATKVINDISIDGMATLGSLNDGDLPRLRAMLLKDLTIIKEEWREQAGSFTVIGVLPLYGPTSAAALGVRRATMSSPIIEVAASELNLASFIPAGYTPQPFTAPYTGVIVNCDHVLISPCLFPTLLRTDGKPFWGPITEPNPLLVANGQMRYAPDLQIALQQNLAGKRPLILTAVGAGKGYHPVMNIDDVFLALQQQKKTELLQRKPVVVTLGQ